MTSHFMFNRCENLEPRLLLTTFASLNSAGVLSIVGDASSNSINVLYSLDKVKVTRDGSSLYFAKSKVKAVWAEAYGGNDKITINVPLPSTLIGDAGNDTLSGNSKNDDLRGGSGDDRLIPGDGSNSVDHGSGNDVIDYSNLPAGVFVLTDLGFSHPGNGVDQVGTSRATVLLTPGNDTFYCRGESDILHSDLIIDGGAGNDTFTAGGFPEQGYVYRINGGSGNDTIFRDVESGGVGFVDAGPGNDVINDNDEAAGPINCDGGSGFDSFNLGFDLDFLGDHDVTVPAGFEAFSTKSNGNLIIRGNSLNNDITGVAPNVTIYGNAGNDRLNVSVDPDSPYTASPGHGLADGGSGNDTLIGNHATVFKGGSGTDTADFSSRTSNLTISLDNLANDGATGDKANVMSDIENVIGGSGNDKITGSSANNILRGGKGNDSLYGGAGADALFGDAGNDVLDGGSGDDYLQGWTGDDALFGRDGNDKLDAGDGNDYLEGNAGNDQVFAGNGSDYVVAKDNTADTLNGGAGTDSLATFDKGLDSYTGFEQKTSIRMYNTAQDASGVGLADQHWTVDVNGNQVPALRTTPAAGFWDAESNNPSYHWIADIADTQDVNEDVQHTYVTHVNIPQGIDVSGLILSANIWADDSVDSVLVNNQSIGFQVSRDAFVAPHHLAITKFLHTGDNTITVKTTDTGGNTGLMFEWLAPMPPSTA